MTRKLIAATYRGNGVTRLVWTDAKGKYQIEDVKADLERSVALWAYCAEARDAAERMNTWAR